MPPQMFDVTGQVLTSALRLLPAETAHDLSLWAMEHGWLNMLPRPQVPKYCVSLQVNVPGIGQLRHPIGLAAGFDKNARCPTAFEHIGLSFLEIGTVTPRPQPGNPKPRLFRQPETHAIINRMGFNSAGGQSVAANVQRLKWAAHQVPLGINIGKNKDTPPHLAINDYLMGFEIFAPITPWITVNISSPNTPGLRDLANPDFIRALAHGIGPKKSKTWIKFDPDLDRRTFQALIACAAQEQFAGVILSNTHRVEWPQSGGLSGHPLLSASNTCLEWCWEVTNGALPMIATGGVISGIDAYQKLARGASAIQIYSALVYRGPGAVYRICEELAYELKLRGFKSAQECVGSFYL